LLAGTGGTGVGALDDALLEVLREHDVPFDVGAVSASVLEATVTAVDPGGRLLSVGESAPGTGVRSVLKAETWAQGLRYLKLAGLHGDAAGTVGAIIADWATNDCSGLVLDLRSAGGDDLAAIDDIAAQFVGGGGDLYVVRDGAGALIETCSAADSGAAPAADVPVMVLIDGETRSASETLAAVLRGRRGALLLGEKSSGDNAVREVLPFTASNALYVATKWVTPLNGGCWQDDGMLPDIVVDAVAGEGEEPEPLRRTGLSRPQSERARLDEELMERVRGDAPLARATDILLGLRALGGVPHVPPAVLMHGGDEKDADKSRDASSREVEPERCNQE